MLLLSVVVLVAGCKKSSTTEPVTKANIIGTVYLYDDGTNLLPGDGMIVNIDGSSPLISAVTGADGSFVLADVPFGTYTLSFSKTGYGTFKRLALVHSDMGGSTIVNPSPSLGQYSTTTITGLTSVPSTNMATLSITTLPAPTSQVPRYVRVFFSKSAAVSFYSYLKYTIVYKQMSNPANLDLHIKTLNEMGFSSGDTVYARAYGDSFWSNDYDNLLSGKREFPDLNSTTVPAVSFVVP
ncbi:MAG: carboxypeptidase-like regulatory domain-containing protein [Bacteroidota bacterium]